jgi:predicted nucleic acid-binding protein
VAAATRQVDEEVNRRRAALLVGLDDEAQAVPAGQRRLEGQALQQLERQLQPVGLLGVDVQADVVAARQQRQLRSVG